MDLLNRFVEYLGSQKINISKITVKNYRADIGQFIRWFEETFDKPFNTKDVTEQLINIYKTSRPLSSRSIKRHLSSLTKFLHFLKIEGVIKSSAKNLSSPKDKWHLNEFKNHLYVYNLASLTIKNYVIDIKQFFVWLEEVTGINKEWDVGKKNVFEKINPTLVNEYKKRLLTIGLSPKTINRKLSSLRKYISFAGKQNLIKTDSEYLQVKNEKLQTKSNQPLQNLRHLADQAELLDSASRQVGIPKRVRDETPIKYSRIPPIRLLQKIINGMLFILDRLLVFPLARTIEQIKYVFWKIKGKPIFKDISNKKLNKQKPKQIENYPKSFYDPLSISTRYFSLHKKLWHYIRHNRPKWYKNYHSYSLVHYFHFAILVIFMSTMGFSIYNDFILKPQNKAVLSALDSNPARILAFKGRLTDSLDNPITMANTALRMAIYNDQTATGSALLWQEVVSVNPNKDGLFEAILGSNLQIPQNIFFQNPSLWLGISIGQTAELTPRQELATVSYAVNTQTLQGLPPITYDIEPRNVILALDSSGNLNIGGSAAPHFQATGGEFTLSGKVLLLTTVFESNSDVIISPDGLGKIDLQKPLQNTSNNNNIPNAIGAVEIDDLLAILATSSAQSALTINQDGAGPIITASSSTATKFTVENSGNIISAQGANWQPTFDSSNGLNIASSSGIPFVTFDTLHQNVGIGTVIPETSLDVFGSFRASGNITLSKFTSNGGILYATKSGSLAQVIPGTTTQCLMGGETPKFANCQASPYNNITETNGNIGIGTTNPLFKLDIQNSQLATAAAQIFNTNPGIDADGLIVKLGNTSTSTVTSSNHFISFETSGIGIVGSIQGSGGKGVTYATSGVADFAEYFKKDENQTIEYGSVLCINDKGLVLPCDKDNTNIVGIASENPAFLGGENLGNKSIAVGLVGQVYTKASTINGDIKPGDPLTSSDIPGIAVKATSAGQIIGKALESCGLARFSSEATLRTNTTLTDHRSFVEYQNGVDSEGAEPSRPTFLGSAPKPSDPTPTPLCGKILTLVNVSWYDPDIYLTDTGDLSIVNQKLGSSNQTDNSSSSLLSIIHDSLFTIQSASGEVVERVGAFAQIAVANLEVGFIKAEKITSEKKIVSPIADIDEVRTNLISPLASEAPIVVNGKLVIRQSRIETNDILVGIENASGSAVVTIDSSGNASFSGALSSKDLEVDSDATVSGTLRAKRILADSIEGLEAKVSTLAANYIKVNQESFGFAQDKSGIRNQTENSSSIIHESSFINQDFNLSSYSAQLALTNLSSSFGTFIQGLMSFGPTSLAETAIAGNLSIQGSLILSNNSIDVLGNDLELQKFRQGGISILAGLITIDNNGNLKAGGNAEFAKDVTIKGDLIASGSATFSKINLSLVQPALAISKTEIIATGSAGVAAIKANQTELTIKNNLITDKSLIYVAPVGTPSAESPFLMRQTPGESFSVGIQTPKSEDLLFNWLILN